MCSGQQQTHKQNCWQYIRLKRSYIRGLENCCRKDKLESLSPAVSVVHQSQRHSPCILLHDSMKRKNTQTNKHWQPKHSQPRIYLVVWSTTFCLTDRQTDRQTRWKQYNIMNMSRKMRCLKIALFKVGLSSIVSRAGARLWSSARIVSSLSHNFTLFSGTNWPKPHPQKLAPPPPTRYNCA